MLKSKDCSPRHSEFYPTRTNHINGCPKNAGFRPKKCRQPCLLWHREYCRRFIRLWPDFFFQEASLPPQSSRQAYGTRDFHVLNQLPARMMFVCINESQLGRGFFSSTGTLPFSERQRLGNCSPHSSLSLRRCSRALHRNPISISWHFASASRIKEAKL
jgi:hypothetical protein